MKNLITIAAVVFASCLNAAQVFTLERGLNRIGAVGEIVAIEANTVAASQNVTCTVVTTVSAGKRIKATHTHRAAIGNGTASSHYLKLVPGSTFNFLGGDIDVECGDGDTIRIMVK